MIRRPATLTWRIALLLTGVVLVAGVLAIVAATFGIRHLLMTSLDQQLATTAAQHEVRMHGQTRGSGTDDDEGADGDARADLRLPVGTITAQVSGSALIEAVVSRTSDAKTLTSEAVSALSSAIPSGQPVSIDVPGIGNYRVVVDKTDDGTLLTGLPQQGIDRLTTKTVLVESLAVGLAALAMAGIGAFAVRRAMRPLRQIATSAYDVSNTPLDTGAPLIGFRPADASAAAEIRLVSDALATLLDHVQEALHTRDASERQLRDFIADASHELRTPVAIVRSHAELIEATVAERSVPAQVGASLDRIADETRRMSDLINDLLLLARLEQTGERASGTVDVSLILLEAVDDARVTAPGHHWQIDLPEEPVLVTGDEEQLRRVIRNLASNVRRHTPEGSEALITLRLESGEAVVTLHDNGPGLPPEVIAGAHQRFNRHRDSGHPESTGLGLAIVHAIASAHGGSVSFASRPGDTTVTLTLPARIR